MYISSNDHETIERLNSLLRCELAAIKSYELALVTLDSTLYHGTLLQCCRSHEARAELLKQEILARGGEPVTDSGAWTNCARLVEFSVPAFADNAAISALAEGEVHGDNDYRVELQDLEPDARRLIESSLIPEQRRTQHAMWDIKRQLAA